ncbi:hypothetical protein CSW23_08370 [Thermus scotoductus]|uniref:LPS-assembly protein LptD n=1 Tax=Thermus scotoductus TaxID=37636 RepID=A0A430V0J1_THESC|nr:hypothetical protein [Thermus scotoductus]RTI00613.1 hypothetical protein CSW31_05400 [Thermus scotoductus]RTI15658.1 hypothetical protein CSW23_08370 [Thermus scotoductus]
MRALKRALSLVGFLFLPALAGPCEGRPYTLETEEGLLGGQEMSYDGEVLLFEGRACLERDGLYLEAPAIRYLEKEGSFQAEGLKGEAEGWRVEARVLLGKELKEVRLAQGQLKAEVASLALGTPLKGRGILLESPAYRVRAEEATFTREEAQLKGFLATPCPCGEDVRLAMEEATFLVRTGELKGDATLGLWGLEVPLEEARANVNRRPDLKNPLILSSSDTGGWTLGLQDFPLPRPGDEIGQWPRRFTLLASGLGTSQEALRLGLREGGRGAEVQLGYAPGVKAYWDDLLFAASPNPPDTDTPRLEARYTPTFRLGNLTLRPFLRYAETARSQGTTVGLEGGYRETLKEGPFSLTFSPSLLFAFYPFTPYAPYLALGGSLEGLFREGDLSLRASYAGRLEPLSPMPPFTFEHRDEFQRLSLEGRYGPFGLRYTLKNPLGQRLDRLEGEFQDPGLGTLRLGYVRGSLEELRLGYAMPLPERTCCQALWLSPEVGLNREGITRLGLTFRYYDGCFAYEVRWQNILKGQYGEATGQSLSFGLSLR